MSNDLTQIKVRVSSPLTHSARARQVSGMFDLPLAESIDHAWETCIDLDWDWQVGLIVGPSGAGKSTIARSLWSMKEHEWTNEALIDQFDEFPIQEVTAAFSSVGFNSIPSWLKPYHVLSTGERFRADMARSLLTGPETEVLAIDEFTSVVDRQVAKIGSHAIQKYVRRHKRQFVAVSCHEDIIDWLQPDWILRPADMSFARRSLRPGRPRMEGEVARCLPTAWRIFAPHHYLSAELSSAAQTFAIFVHEQPVAFAGILWQPVSTGKTRDIVRVSRLVVLPDWQGAGLGFVLLELLAKAYASIEIELRIHTSHPSLVLALDRHKHWRLVKRPVSSNRASTHRSTTSPVTAGAFGGVAAAGFAWTGGGMDEKTARRILHNSTYGR